MKTSLETLRRNRFLSPHLFYAYELEKRRMARDERRLADAVGILAAINTQVWVLMGMWGYIKN